MIFVISLLFVGIITIESPFLVKNKMWRELAAFILLLMVGLIYSLGLVLNQQLPNLRQLIETIFAPVTKLIENFL